MPSMFFSPNLTGALHIGSGIVLWFTAREAKASGARFIICLDNIPGTVDVPGHARPKPTVQARIDTMQSTIKACELLDIEPDAWHFRSEYQSRYFEVADMLKDQGLIYESEPGMWKSIYAHKIKDRAMGDIGGQAYIVRACNAVSRAFCTLVDWWDFDVRLHIRGSDIIAAADDEAALWQTVAGTLGEREPMQYAHIATITRADGSPLHKSLTNDPAIDRTRYGIEGDPYSFEAWAQKYQTPEQRRDALEKIVLARGKTYALENLIPRPKVRVTYNPETGEAIATQEKSLLRRTRERRGLWVDY